MAAAVKTKQVLGPDLRLGMVYANRGALYQIDSVEFQQSPLFPFPQGRYFVRSHWVGGWNPNFSNDDFNSALRADLFWTIIDA